MNYHKIYKSLIDRSIDRVIEGYTEKHHILPKCMGGSNDPSNIAILTPEEHFLAHQLLVKMHPEVSSLIVAARIMTRSKNDKRVNNKLFGWLKRDYAIYTSNLHKGKTITEEHKKKLIIGHSTIPRTEKQLNNSKRMGEMNKGRKLSDETKLKMSAAHKKRLESMTDEERMKDKERRQLISSKNKGRTHSEESKANMSAAKKGKPMSEENKEIRRLAGLAYNARRRAEKEKASH
ncbi:hypothetical protein [Aeromonas phage phiWae14]|nr:hypothetical protein [Aeromonas phage phiWae14]